MKGWCSVHYSRFRNYGDPHFIPPKVARIARTDALLLKCATDPAALEPGECWEWPGSRLKTGYGHCGRKHGTKMATRIVWIERNGPIPAGMVVCHRCDNPPCVRPSHLFLGAQLDNVHDMIRKGRQAQIWGDDHAGIKLSDDDVAEMRRLRAAEGLLYREIAERFGVSLRYAQDVVRGSRRSRRARSYQAAERDLDRFHADNRAHP